MRNPIFSLILLICAGCSEESVRLNSEDLKELLKSDKSADFETVRFTGHVKLKVDKTAFLSIPALGDDTGIWWIENNQLCSKWKSAIQGKVTCAHISVRSDGTYVGHHPNTGFQIGTFKIDDYPV